MFSGAFRGHKMETMARNELKMLKHEITSQFANHCIYQLSIPFHSIYLSSNSRHFNLLNSGLCCLLN